MASSAGRPRSATPRGAHVAARNDGPGFDDLAAPPEVPPMLPARSDRSCARRCHRRVDHAPSPLEPVSHWWSERLSAVDPAEAGRELAHRWPTRHEPAATPEDRQWWTGWNKTTTA